MINYCRQPRYEIFDNMMCAVEDYKCSSYVGDVVDINYDLLEAEAWKREEWGYEKKKYKKIKKCNCNIKRIIVYTYRSDRSSWYGHGGFEAECKVCIKCHNVFDKVITMET